jgi:hypothetical protein
MPPELVTMRSPSGRIVVEVHGGLEPLAPDEVRWLEFLAEVGVRERLKRARQEAQEEGR